MIILLEEKMKRYKLYITLFLLMFLNMLSAPSSLLANALNSWKSINSVNTALERSCSKTPKKLVAY